MQVQNLNNKMCLLQNKSRAIGVFLTEFQYCFPEKLYALSFNDRQGVSGWCAVFRHIKSKLWNL